eukprot:g34186.t1
MIFKRKKTCKKRPANPKTCGVKKKKKKKFVRKSGEKKALQANPTPAVPPDHNVESRVTMAYGLEGGVSVGAGGARGVFMCGFCAIFPWQLHSRAIWQSGAQGGLSLRHNHYCGNFPLGGNTIYYFRLLASLVRGLYLIPHCSHQALQKLLYQYFYEYRIILDKKVKVDSITILIYTRSSQCILYTLDKKVKVDSITILIYIYTTSEPSSSVLFLAIVEIH